MEGLIRAFSRDLSTEFSNSVDIFSFFREISRRATVKSTGAAAPKPPLPRKSVEGEVAPEGGRRG